MKRTIAVLPLTVEFLTPAQTRKSQPGQGTNATARALLDLENKWVRTASLLSESGL